jgi:hypothetical protein
MTARELIRAATLAGATLTPNGDTVWVEPSRPLPAELVAELRAHKAEILAYLTRPVPTPEEVLHWTFEEVDRHRARIKIRSRLLGCDLWLVGRGDPGPGDGLPVYDTTEVRELLKLRPENLAAKVQAAHLAKLSFGPAATVEEVLPA